VTAGIVVLAGAALGFSVVRTPLLAWALVGVVAAAVLLLSPPHVRIAAAVLAATCSRLVVATGYVSSFANFVHYPLVLAVALIAAVESPRRVPGRRALELALLSLLVVSLASWLVNGGDVLRPFLDWLVFAEPLLIVYAVSTMSPTPQRRRFLGALVLAIAFVQMPLAVYQALVFGVSDPVQGLFIGMGAAAHVAGAVSVVAGIVCVARGLSDDQRRSKIAWIVAGIVLSLVAVIADAKQVIIAFLPALVVVLVISGRLRVPWIVLSSAVVVAVTAVVFALYHPLQKALDWELISRGALGKLNAFSVIAGKLSTGWAQWIVGLGPGNSVSRVAMMGLDAFVKHDSPVYLLGLGPAATTVELWNLTASSRLYASSSVWSFVSSWLGLLGDLGLAGIMVYVWALAVVWRNLRRGHGWEQAAAQAVILMMIFLAFLYSWLEEPGYTVTAALVIGLGSVVDPRERSPHGGRREAFG
jgi:hypothetical protein